MSSFFHDVRFSSGEGSPYSPAFTCCSWPGPGLPSTPAPEAEAVAMATLPGGAPHCPGGSPTLPEGAHTARGWSRTLPSLLQEMDTIHRQVQTTGNSTVASGSHAMVKKLPSFASSSEASK